MKVGNRRIVLALAASLSAAACAPRERYATEDIDRWPAVAVEVTNHNWMDVTVYAVTATQLVRLGSVTTGAHVRFELPRTLDTLRGDFYLEARPTGSRRIIRSQPILASPGARVIWSVENEVSLSSLRIA